MEFKTFIFIGRSGCGKGTQVKFLMDELKKRYPGDDIFYLQTGQHFRDFVAQDGFANALSKKIMDDGGRQPDFLAIWIWSNAFLNNIKNQEHAIIDGTPRSLNEARILDTAIRFFGREKPYVIYIDVSREESERRLLERGRADDLEIEDIRRRLDWFEDDVMPAVSFYRDNPDYNFVFVHGEQSVEGVHKEIMEKVFGDDIHTQ